MPRFVEDARACALGGSETRSRSMRFTVATLAALVLGLLLAVSGVAAASNPGLTKEPAIDLECSLDSDSGAHPVVTCEAAVNGFEDPQALAIESQVQVNDEPWSNWVPASLGPLQVPAAEVTRVQVRATDDSGATWSDSETVAMNPEQAAELAQSQVPDPGAGCDGQAATVVATEEEQDAVAPTPGSDVVVVEDANAQTPSLGDGDTICGGATAAVVGDASVPMVEGQVTANSLVDDARSKPFGYHDIFHADLNRIDLAAAGGSDTVRITVYGCPGGGIDTAPFTRAGQKNQQIVLLLLWQRNCGDPVAFPYDTQHNAWRQFVRDAVSLATWYSGKQVYVEVWNEPNVDTNNTGTVSAFWYAHAYWYAWQGVQDAEQTWVGFNFPVMTAGMGRPGHNCVRDDSNFNCVETFLNRVRDTLNSWGSVYMVEMTGAHIYPDPTTVLTRSQSSDQVGEQFNAVRRPFPSIYTPTFITETGIRTDGGYDQAAQCNRLLDIYNGWLPSTVTAGMVVWRLKDDPNFPQVNYRYMGTVDQGGNGKSAFFYLQAENLGWAHNTSCA